MAGRLLASPAETAARRGINVRRTFMRQGCREVRSDRHVASPSPPRAPHLGENQGADGHKNACYQDKAKKSARPPRSRQHGNDQAANHGRKNPCDELLLKLHQRPPRPMLIQPAI
jgi:hypothetical protein